MSTLENFEKMLAQGRDSALLRYSLGTEYMKLGRFAESTLHLRDAVRQNPGYSAAWKLLGKTLVEQGMDSEALDAFRQGITIAEAKGDIQAAKEMKVFAKRIEKRHASEG